MTAAIIVIAALLYVAIMWIFVRSGDEDDDF